MKHSRFGRLCEQGNANAGRKRAAYMFRLPWNYRHLSCSFDWEIGAYKLRPMMNDETRSEALTKSEAASRAQPQRPRRILVVDDEPAARVLSKRVLTEAGFEVITVQSGFECLERFRQQPHGFDLILLDLSMPFMDGEETFRRLRAVHPNVAVLLSTGFLTQAQERIERMLAAGLAGSIRKPHHPDELLAQVNAILERAMFSRAGCMA